LCFRTMRQRGLNQSFISLRHQKLESEQAGDISLGFLDSAIGLLQLQPRIGFASADFDLVWPESVSKLMSHDMGKKQPKIQVPLGRGLQHNFGDWNQRGLELPFLDVLEHYPLA